MTDQKDALIKSLAEMHGEACACLSKRVNEVYALKAKLAEESAASEHDINALMEANRGLHDEVAGYKARVEKLREELAEAERVLNRCRYSEQPAAKRIRDALEADGEKL